jgi:hypothetical protein
MSFSMGAMIAQKHYDRGSAARPLEARSRQGRIEAQLLLSSKQSLGEAEEISTRTVCTSDAQTERLSRIQEDSEAIDHNLDQSEFLSMELKPFGWVRNMFRREPNAPQRSSAGNRSRSSPAFAAPGGHPAFLPGQAWGTWGLRTATSTASPIVDKTTVERHNKTIPDITDAVARDHERMKRQSQNMRERLLG